MCGIAGIFTWGRGSAADQRELARMCDQMARRGPDDQGAWQSPDGSLALGHRRLSIIELTRAGAQPMASADGNLVVTFNGEIYNHAEIRQRLEAKGRVFRSRSDTEVLLHLYAEKGEAMVEELRGMFAFAIYDAQRRGLLLARDPFGIKPLYYSDAPETFRFASQVKALLAGGAVSTAPDAAGWAGFFLFGSVPDPFTTYRDVKAIPHGATMWVDARGPSRPRRYFRVAEIYREAEAEQCAPSPAEAEAEARSALLDSVRHHLVADVPVGAFLSAGVDSGSLVGLMRDAGQGDILTVTLAFEEFRASPEDEAPIAELVARQYGTRHTTRRVDEQEFADDLPQILAAMDQPSVDGINTWFVAKAARELGLKVAISGVGGDELFGGYSTFCDIPRLVRLMALPAHVPLLGDGVRRAVSSFTRRTARINPKWAGLVKLGGDYPGAYLLRRGLFMPWELDELMGRDEAQEGLERLQPLALAAEAMTPEPATAFGRVATLESTLYMGNQLLRDTDWASMAHSLEVRVPLVDTWLLRRMAPILVRGEPSLGKGLLARAPRKPLPPSVLARPKSGFGMPYEKWIGNRFGPCKRGISWSRRWASEVATGAATPA